MAKRRLTDAEAKAILLRWPGRTKGVWPAPNARGFWVRAQPRLGVAPGPRLSSPGAKLFTTQPDGLWAHFDEENSCDVVAIEVCGTIQNLNDKRSRYFPASHSLVLTCGRRWFLEFMTVQRGGQAPRWRATGTLTSEPVRDLSIPVRHLRVLYAIPNTLYDDWKQNHVPTGYELFCPHSSLDSYNSQKMQIFLSRMSVASQFYM
jgi:hypothetical protein